MLAAGEAKSTACRSSGRRGRHAGGSPADDLGQALGEVLFELPPGRLGARSAHIHNHVAFPETLGVVATKKLSHATAGAIADHGRPDLPGCRDAQTTPFACTAKPEKNQTSPGHAHTLLVDQLELTASSQSMIQLHSFLHRQALPPLAPAGGQHPAAPGGSHADPKPVSLLAVTIVRLKRSLHDLVPLPPRPQSTENGECTSFVHRRSMGWPCYHRGRRR